MVDVRALAKEIVAAKVDYWLSPEEIRSLARALLDALEQPEQLGQQAAAPSLESGLEDIAQWMMAHSYATGPGDTIADLLAELVEQVRERAVAPPPVGSDWSDTQRKTVLQAVCCPEGCLRADDCWARTKKNIQIADAVLAALSTPSVRGGK